MDILEVIIGSGDSARIALRPLFRTHPDANDFWDGNWIDCKITVRAGAFQGSYVACLRTNELAALLRDVEHAYHDLAGTISFRSMEEWVYIEMKGDGLGHFTGTCLCRDRAGGGNELRAEIEFDQTDLVTLRQQLAALLLTYPVIGTP